MKLRKRFAPRWSRIVVVALGVALLASLAVPAPGTHAGSSEAGQTTGDAMAEYVDGEVLVRFKARVSDKAAKGSLSAVGAESIEYYDRIGVHRLELQGGVEVEEAVAILNADENVEYAEPNYVFRADTIPDDPEYLSLWGMDKIEAPGAWDITTGSSDVVVAVIDTGVDYTHEDLAANMWQNPGEIPGNGVDDDGNGYVDDIYGIDTYNDDSDPMDDHGHGTHCAGTIGAVGNNGIGVVGVNWNVEIMALKFLSSGGYGYTSDAVDALEYVIDMEQNRGVNVRITSNSWGGGGYSQSLYDAIAAAGDADILFIAAAGNDYGSNNDLYPFYPSSYGLENVIAVAATDQSDDLAYFSNYGPTSVDLAAPGVDILSTVPGNDYEYFRGTSMATPHVSGVAALVLAANPGHNYLQVKATIMDSVDTVPNLDGMVLTGGRLNARWASGPVLVRPTEFDEALPVGAVEDYTLEIKNNRLESLTFNVTDDAAWIDEVPTTGTIPGFETAVVTVTIDTTGLPFGEYWTDIMIANNDPDEDPTVVPVRIRALTTGTVYVNSSATGADNGRSWDDAFTDLQSALDISGFGAEIWVASGTYVPSDEHGGTGDRYRSFQLTNGVAVYGGFPNSGNPSWDDRNWEANPTILSGDIGTIGDDSDNCYHVFYHPVGLSLDSTAILDGFIITDGNADSSGDHINGGGMYNNNSSPQVTNCTFTGNSAVYSGGGMYNLESAPAVTNCTFTANTAGSGGGMCSEYYASPTVTNCIFDGNSASSGGGMWNFLDCAPTVDNCVFTGNSAVYSGGGMGNYSSAPAVTNCTFTANTAGSFGGGIYCSYSSGPLGSPRISDCAIVSNMAGWGGGIYCDGTSPTISNCTIARNQAVSGRGGGINASRGTSTVINCTVTGNTAEAEGGGMSFTDGRPAKVINCTISGNISGSIGGGFYCYDAITVTNCTITANRAGSAGGGVGLYGWESDRIMMNCILWANMPNEVDVDSVVTPVPTVTYCDIQGGYDGEGNVDADPLFEDPDNGDFHLRTGSPCIDAGTNDATELPDTDFEGDPRIFDGDNDGTATVDMGADECANRPPTDIILSSSSVAENEPEGTLVGTFSSTDPDAGDTHRYNLVSGTGDADNGAFTIVDDELRTSSVFDYESNSGYGIRVQTDDGNGGTYEKQFRIAITDVNEVPTDINLSNAMMSENEPVGAIVGAFSTVDQDPGDSHTYGLVSGAGDDDNSSFSIDGDILRAAESFDYETKNSYSLRVQTDDGNGGIHVEQFTVTINDVNEAPVADHQTVTTDEDSAVDITLTGSDVDGDALTFSVIDQPTHGTLSGTAPNLTYTPDPDYNGPDSFTFTVDDGTLDSDVATVTITVNPVDEPADDDQDDVTDSDDGGTDDGVQSDGTDDKDGVTPAEDEGQQDEQQDSDQGGDEEAEPGEADSDSGLPLWAWVLIGVGVAIVPVGIAFVLRRTMAAD